MTKKEQLGEFGKTVPESMMNLSYFLGLFFDTWNYTLLQNDAKSVWSKNVEEFLR